MRLEPIHAAAALLKASAVMGASPVEVVSILVARFQKGLDFRLHLSDEASRARALAAWALREMPEFENSPTALIVRYVGVGPQSEGSYLSNLRQRVQSKTTPWINSGTLARVIEAVRLEIHEVKDTEAYAPAVTAIRGLSQEATDDIRKALTVPQKVQTFSRGGRPGSAGGCSTKPKSALSKYYSPDDFKGPLTAPKKPVPAEQCANVTAELCGDPHPSRSALAEYVEKENQKLRRKTEESFP